MSDDPFKIEILRDTYEDHFQTAQQHRHRGEKQDAARAFDQAATALEKLAAATGENRATDIERLQRAASILRSGERLDDYFKREQQADDDESQGDRERRQPPGSDDDETRKQMESFICETSTTWDDIGGLESVQRDLKRAIALGSIEDTPDAVTATDRILLFGPPGTGKTLLASAVAGSLDASFFQVELGNLLSKWYGESSKQISALFDTAADLSPSVVFLDEVDSLTQSRSSEMNETSRRVLDTLLSELDGVEKEDDAFTLTLAATNTPWSLDSAIRSRFPQRIHVPLPDEAAAAEIIRIHTVKGGIGFDGRPADFVPDSIQVPRTEDPAEAIAKLCVDGGYTGRDLEALCAAAVNNMLYRRNPGLEELVDVSVAKLRHHDLELGLIQPGDVWEAFETTSSSLPEEDVARFYEWSEEYGTGTVAR